jgi:hypothetical protein
MFHNGTRIGAFQYLCDTGINLYPMYSSCLFCLLFPYYNVQYLGMIIMDHWIGVDVSHLIVDHGVVVVI